MKKYILIVVSLIVLGFLGYKYLPKEASLTNELTATSTSETASTTGSISGQILSEKDRAWTVLERYLEASKKHDLKTLTELSYQLSDACKDKEQEAECFNRMDSVSYFGSNLKKEDMKNIWSDSKQIILTSDLRREDDKDIIGYSKSIIYFVYDKGVIKLLKFNDSKGVSMPKEGRTVEEINDYLQKRMEDTDQDGIEDEIESCIDQGESCVKTDPKKRDTDKDGFWDGVEAQFNK